MACNFCANRRCQAKPAKTVEMLAGILQEDAELESRLPCASLRAFESHRQVLGDLMCTTAPWDLPERTAMGKLIA